MLFLLKSHNLCFSDTFLDDMLNALKISVDPDEEASNYETAPEESDSKDTVAENANHSEEEVQKTSETCPDINEIVSFLIETSLICCFIKRNLHLMKK